MSEYTHRRRPKPTDLAAQAKKVGMTQALLRALQDGSARPTPAEASKLQTLTKRKRRVRKITERNPRNERHGHSSR